MLRHGQRNGTGTRSKSPIGRSSRAVGAAVSITLSVVFFLSCACDKGTRDVLSETGRLRGTLTVCGAELDDARFVIKDRDETIERQARQIESDEEYEMDLRFRLHEAEQARYEAESEAQSWQETAANWEDSELECIARCP